MVNSKLRNGRSLADFIDSISSSSSGEVENSRNRLINFYGWLKRFDEDTLGFASTESGGDSLDRLYTDGFDVEQIWQQLELYNNECLRAVKKLSKDNKQRRKEDVGVEDVGEILEGGDGLAGDGFDDDDEDEMGGGLGDDENAEDRSDDETDDTLFENEENAYPPSNVGEPPAESKRSIVDDRFFNLAAMSAFLDKQDVAFEADKEDNEEITQLIGAADSDAADDDCRYEGFFDPPTSVKRKGKATSKKKVTFEDDAIPNNGEDRDKDKFKETAAVNNVSDAHSTFEDRQSRLKEAMAKMEDENLSEKSWQMLGEASSSTRPDNALLEEHLDFEHTTRAAPEITLDSTERLENLILQRIRDKCFDDVQRKTKPVAQPRRFRNELVLDQEKPNKSLAQIYEEQYLKQTGQAEETEKKNPKHESIRKKMKELFRQLDALTNYHYSPKMPETELRIVKDMPTIAAEEVAPTALADPSSQLAPEEIQEPKPADFKEAEERTETDRKRNLRKRKLKEKWRAARKEIRNKERSTVVEAAVLAKIGLKERKRIDPSSAVGVKQSSVDFFQNLTEGNRSMKKNKAAQTKTAAQHKF